jgi:hypothetical protein
MFGDSRGPVFGDFGYQKRGLHDPRNLLETGEIAARCMRATFDDVPSDNSACQFIPLIFFPTVLPKRPDRA